MQIATMPMLSIFYALNRRYKKRYCFPSQSKIVELLGKFHNVDRSVRTINRWLRDLEDDKCIKRIRRIRRDPVFGYVFKSTLYKITKRGYMVLWRAGVDCFDKIKNMAPSGKNIKYSQSADELVGELTHPLIDKSEMRSAWEKVKSKLGNIAVFFMLQ